MTESTLPMSMAWERARRFLGSLRTSIRFAAGRRGRSLMHPENWGVTRALRRAWLVSDPEWLEKLQGQYRPDPEWSRSRRDARDRARAEARARREAEGPAIYEGNLYVRPAYRGMLLDDLAGRPDIEEWLEQQLGLDNYGGDTIRVRITADLGPDPSAPRQC